MDFAAVEGSKFFIVVRYARRIVIEKAILENARGCEELLFHGFG
jgi:hypothetical protein